MLGRIVIRPSEDSYHSIAMYHGFRNGLFYLPMIHNLTIRNSKQIIKNKAKSLFLIPWPS